LKNLEIHEFPYDTFQLKAIEAIQKGLSVIVSAPTGAGKTVVAEYATSLAMEAGKGIIYTAPIKALSNQKYRDFVLAYGKDNVGILTGDVVINAEAPVLIMTTEIFRNRLFEHEHLFDNRRYVIFDEIHYMDDVERGTVWEESLIFFPKNLKFLALSATIPNIHELAGWIESIHHHPIVVIEETLRPVPLHFRFMTGNKIYEGFNELQKQFDKKHSYKPNELENLIHHLRIKDTFPAIYFAFGRMRCETMAKRSISFNLVTLEERKNIMTRYRELLKLFRLEGDSHAEEMTPLIEHGIAFHHAGILPTLKEVVERLFTEKLLKLIFTTETFALGINMPARAVIFDELRKFYGNGFDFLKTRDFYQMAGRAGRRGFDDYGLVYSLVNPRLISFFRLKEIILNQPEAIYSQFNSNYATVLHLYRTLGEKILDIYPLSFHHFQSGNKGKRKGLLFIKNKIALLKHLGFIHEEKLTSRGHFGLKIFGYELITTELFMDGFFENATPSEINVMLLAMIFEPRKNQQPPALSKLVRPLKSYADRIHSQVEKMEKNFNVEYRTKRFYFHLSDAMLSWMKGISFEELHQLTDVDEGEIIRNFRMTLQTVRELKSVSGCYSRYYDNLSECIRLIKRDIVDPDAQFELG
jgi:superfamily II RNA helicase